MSNTIELQEYKVQRKVIAWEEITVEATSFKEAKRIACLDENIYDWELKDESEPTNDFWIMNTETGEEELF